MASLPVKYGRFDRWEHNRQVVITDTGETFYLTPGFDAARDAKPGDRIKLEYRASSSLGLWYGSVVPTIQTCGEADITLTRNPLPDVEPR